MNFNPSQSRAAAHTKGPCLVLAGPGSGKTAVITRRTRELITQRIVSPGNILVVTFTRAAAAEMRQRFTQMTEGAYPGVTFGTFHAVFFTVLKHAYHYSAANIAREEIRYQFMQEIIAKNQIECDDVKEFASHILSEISALKNSGSSCGQYVPIHCSGEIFQTLVREYSRYMSQSRLIDFDDILVYTKELFEQRSDILSAWQHKYSYIMVDEFQDINQLQYQTVSMLAGGQANLFVVGDDDQSIYRFRGSDPQLMLNFPKDYPSAQIIRLSVNYRCPKEVVQKAGNLIRHNEKRFEKQIESAGTSGRAFYCCQYAHIQEESKAIIEQIRSFIRQGGSYRQIAVLYRTNRQPGPLIAALMEYNLPFHTKEQIPCLYEHWIARDILTYFALACGSRARSDFLRIMNRPHRYISRESLTAGTVSFDSWQAYYKNQEWIAERIGQLECDLKVISRITPFAAINYIRKGMEYDGFLEKFAQHRQIPPRELQDVLEELQESAKGYRHPEEWMEFTRAYTEQLKQRQEHGRQMRDSESISVMTLHGAKGLEFDLVFIPDLNEGLIPYKKAVLEEELEEERRMLYVGMTRAKKELHVSHVKNIWNRHAEPSRFLSEILDQDVI